MEKQDSIAMRTKLLILMQKQKFSTYTRLSIILHIANLKPREQGDNMVEDLIALIESGTTEQLFRNHTEGKYGVQMLSEQQN